MKTFTSIQLCIIQLIVLNMVIACSNIPDHVNQQNIAINDHMTAQQESSPYNRKRSPVTTMVNKAWLGNHIQPLSMEMTLPETFFQSYVFRFPNNGKLTLEQVAERFTRVTRIPVRIQNYTKESNKDKHDESKEIETSSLNKPIANTQPAKLSDEKFPTTQTELEQLAQSLNLKKTAKSQSNKMPLLIPAQNLAVDNANMVRPSINNQNIATQMSVMNFSGTPLSYLNELTAKLGLNWEYRNGVVHLQRLMTRVFVIKTTPGSSTISFENARSGSSQNGSGSGQIQSGFNSSSSISSKATIAAMEEVRDAISMILTTDGKVTMSPATGTITVIDRKDIVDSAAKIIDRQNEILTRSAKFRVEVYSIRDSQNDQAGVSWDMILRSLSDKWGMALSSPATLAELTTTGNIGMQILRPTAGSNLDRFRDSSAMLSALSQIGKINAVYNVDVVARNRRPTPIAITNQTTYLAQTIPATATAGGTGGVPGLVPGTLTTGFSLQLNPNIMDSNQVALQFALSVVDLIGIKTITVGAGTSSQSIQAPETSGFEFVQDVYLRPGETLVLTGYERRIGQYSQRTLAPDAPILAGGSQDATGSREKLAIMITPISVTSAN